MFEFLVVYVQSYVSDIHINVVSQLILIFIYAFNIFVIQFLYIYFRGDSIKDICCIKYELLLTVETELEF